jgi:hypothetical protein
MSSTAQTATEIRPFKVSVSDDELADLRRRIAATRWPDREPKPARRGLTGAAVS